MTALATKFSVVIKFFIDIAIDGYIHSNSTGSLLNCQTVLFIFHPFFFSSKASDCIHFLFFRFDCVHLSDEYRENVVK